MLAIGRILRTGARLLLLDEPTEGLAPVIVQQIGAHHPRGSRSEGFTILLVEQNFRFAATVADRHYVMEHGRVVDMIRQRGARARRPQAARVPRGLIRDVQPQGKESTHASSTAHRRHGRRRARRCAGAGRRPRSPTASSRSACSTTMSSLYADLAGQGSVVAARMAVEDFGAAKKGMKVEIVSADHQNKADVGSSIARQWYDADKVDVIVDVPNSGGRARGQPDHQATRARRSSSPGAASLRPHRQGVLAQHRPLDLRHLGARQRHRQRDREDGRRHLVLPHRGLRLRPRARARHRGGGDQERRQGAGQGAPPAQHRRTSRRSCCRRRPPRPRSSASPTPAATPSTRSSRPPSSASSRAGRTWPACSCSSPTCTRSGCRPRRA